MDGKSWLTFITSGQEQVAVDIAALETRAAELEAVIAEPLPAVEVPGVAGAEKVEAPAESGTQHPANDTPANAVDYTLTPVEPEAGAPSAFAEFLETVDIPSAPEEPAESDFELPLPASPARRPLTLRDAYGG